MWCVEFSNKVKWNTDTHHITLSAKYFQITRLLHLKGKKKCSFASPIIKFCVCDNAEIRECVRVLYYFL